ncbi:MAG TPA: hypothetical protein VFS42_00360 [Burkholderiaceae bacterium]|nr:hypothetical protein [Burkholderiaceae bacterium]
MRLDRLLPAALIALAGCATPASSPVVVVPPMDDVTVLPHVDIVWSDYLARVREMGPNELRGEVADVAGLTSPVGRLQLAMLLTAPQNAARDEQAAQTLAEDVAGNAFAPASVRDAAAMFAQLLAERRRSDDLMRRSQQRAADDAKRIEQAETRVRELERRAADAERKLEALKQIDKALNERAPSGSTSRP